MTQEINERYEKAALLLKEAESYIEHLIIDGKPENCSKCYGATQWIKRYKRWANERR